jgi:hypothetical protein
MNEELSNIDIALFALYKLGGTSKKVHTEHIAWEAYQLARERFSWRLPEFRDRFPDKSPVRFALEQAKKEEHGKLVDGRAGGDIGRPELEGWRFTAKGAEWIRGNEIRIAKALKQKKPGLPKREAESFARKLRADDCFKHFQRQGDLNETSSYMFTDMLDCAPDASKEIIRERFDRLLATAKLVNDEDIIRFLEACAKSFIALLNPD